MPGLDPSSVIVRHLVPGGLEDVQALVARAEALDDHPALSDQGRLDLAARVDGPLRLGAWADGDGLVGYGQAVARGGAWEAELVLDPGLDPSSRLVVTRALTEAVMEAVGRHGGGPLTLWRTKAQEGDARVAAELGLAGRRDLLQLRRPLPLPADLERRPLALRPFRPGADEAAWLAVNNRAFAAHPEQGRWTLDDVLAREREPWFDPEGFLLYEEAGRLVGSCWTKVHGTTRPPMGEIYVISVDPEFAGRGLGRALTVAGLDWLAGTGLTTAMLYVDADNTAAVGLYTDLGMHLDHVDRAFTAEVPPSA